MKPQRRKTNPKRRLHKGLDRARAVSLAQSVTYRGSPLHKRAPGDFGLTPPAAPRPGKSLCDGVGIFEAEVATTLLRDGARRGLVSDDATDGFPRYVWGVTEGGRVLEARRDDPERGLYHGYPLERQDPMAELVLRRWREQEQ